MIRTNFTPDGLDIGKGDRNLTYIYGLSDFWSFIYEDKEKINLLLEANSQKLSDIYSKFLQLSSTISLSDIVTSTGQQLKLVLIKESEAVVGEVNTYTLTETITGARLIANRPLLPTVYLENDIHYRIKEDGSSIQFYQSLASIGFPNRTLSDGTREYALWFVDAKIDEQFLYDYYGKLIGVSPEVSTENFKNFLYGLYFLYSNGPNLDLVRKGLNLTLGIPLARETETVLDIRKYLDTDQYLVTTDLNSYLIPYGLTPTVAEGDTVEATDELAQWIEVKDYVNDNGWWINLHIPEKLIPYIPSGETDRYATAGSYADYLMENFLKYHTFLVNVKTIDFKNLQSFEQLSSIINEVKPSYTTPIYIWTVPTTKETIHFGDDELHFTANFTPADMLTRPAEKMVRNNAMWAYFASDVNAAITIAGDQVTKNTTSTTSHGARANTLIAAGQDHYFELTISSLLVAAEQGITIGIGTSSHTLTSQIGSSSGSYAYKCLTTAAGSFKRSNGSDTAYGSTVTTGDVIGVHVRLSSGLGDITFYKNGVSMGVAYTGLSTDGTTGYYPMVAIAQPTGTIPTKLNTAVVNAAGTGYAIGDVLTVAGGTSTQAALVCVTSVNGSGAITNVHIINAGSYTVDPALANTPTGGTGAGATLTLTMVAQSDVLLVNFGGRHFAYPVPAPSTTNPGVYTLGKLLSRGVARFTRIGVDQHIGGLLGMDSQINGATRAYEGGVVKGFINHIHQFRENTYREAAWLRMFQTGTQDMYKVPTDFVNFPRTITSFYDNSGVPVREFVQTDPTMRVIYLYSTTQADVQNKFSSVGSVAPGLDTWTFTLAQSLPIDPVVDEAEVNAEIVQSNFSLLQSSFNTFFFREISDLSVALPPGNLATYRSDTANYLKKFMPPQGYETWAPEVTDLVSGDYILFIRIMDDIVGVYWVTSNATIDAPYVRISNQTDQLGLEFDTAVSRRYTTYSTWYLLRGAGGAITAGTGSVDGIDTVGINSAEPGATLYVTYTDDYNTPAVTMDRSGKILTHRRDFK
jgi:hypothetical protein